MLRLAYLLGVGYLVVCGAVLLRTPHASVRLAADVTPAVRRPPAPEGAAGWFAAIRPRCNAVELEIALRSSPPPPGNEGTSYLAGCHALSGNTERAKQVIDGMPAEARRRAADIVFEIVHPIADAGDDRSAGPMMRLVLEYAPDNFMALYHAGMSEHALGDHERAAGHLRRFLELYRADDGWTRNAREVLERPELRRHAR